MYRFYVCLSTYISAFMFSFYLYVSWVEDIKFGIQTQCQIKTIQFGNSYTPQRSKKEEHLRIYVAQKEQGTPVTILHILKGSKLFALSPVSAWEFVKHFRCIAITIFIEKIGFWFVSCFVGLLNDEQLPCFIIVDFLPFTFACCYHNCRQEVVSWTN